MALLLLGARQNFPLSLFQCGFALVACKARLENPGNTPCASIRRYSTMGIIPARLIRISAGSPPDSGNICNICKTKTPGLYPVRASDGTPSQITL